MTNQVYRMTVGQIGSDIVGFTQSHIQAAVDRVALLGGGEVSLSKGVFKMADALHLRSCVTVRGQGASTVLKKNRMKSARITSFLGYGHQDLEVDTPDVFKVGDGVLIRDNNAFGFYTTVATLVRREGRVWITNRPHNHDYLGSNGGVVETLFPVVEAVGIHDAILEGVRIEGNSKANPVRANGCRAGGFLALNCQRLRVRDVIVRDYNGDGFGFQTCDDMEVSDCVVEGCSGNGFHPGSGSNRFIMRRCVARKNGECGLFYCLRVRDGLLEDSRFEQNGSHGVSVGERDCGNLNRNLIVQANGGAGLYFRKCDRANAPHQTVFEGCTVSGNGRGRNGGEAQVVVQGDVDGIRLVGNRISWHPPKSAILIKEDVRGCAMQDNRLEPFGDLAVCDLRPVARQVKAKKRNKGGV